MARKTKPTQNKSIRTKKKNKSSTVKRLDGFNKPRMLVFVMLFALVGVVLLLRSYAQSDLPPGDKDIVLAYIDHKPSTISRDSSGKLTYESTPSANMVLKDGTLLCDDGNSEGVVNTGQVSKGQVIGLREQIENLQLETLPENFKSGYEQTVVNNYESFLIGRRSSTVAYEVHDELDKPNKLKNMQNLITKFCDNATQKTDRQSIALLSNRPKAKNNDKLASLVDTIFPKAEALTPDSSTTTNKYGYANDQYVRINQTRSQVGKRTLGNNLCLRLIAERHAQRLAEREVLKHSTEPGYGFKNTYSEILNVCKYDFRCAGENVGRDYSGDSKLLYQAFVNSPGHYANIVNSYYQYAGVGAFQNKNSREIFVTHVFMGFIDVLNCAA